MRVLTLKQLEQARACPEQRAKFQELFGEEVEVTPELCKQYAGEFDLWWALRYLLQLRYSIGDLTKGLSGQYHQAVDPVLLQFDRDTAEIFKVRNAGIKAAVAAYEVHQKVTQFHAEENAVDAAYMHSTAPFREIRDAALVSLKRTYTEGLAVLFCELYNAETA